MNTRLSKELKRRLLYGPDLGESPVTLTVHVVEARNGWANLRFTLDDKNGVELVQLAQTIAQESTAISLTEVHRCFDVKIS